MTSHTPDFHELVGDEGTPEELAQLRRAHDLLVAAGPPPELSPRLAEAPRVPDTTSRGSWVPRARLRTAFVLGAGVAAAAFGIGFLVGDRGSSEFAARGSPIAMHASQPGSTAKASILLGDRDEVGNWPMLVRVSGLKPLPDGQWYELYLTRKGKPAAYCGSFSAGSSGRTTVHFSVPYKLKGFDGWIVTTSAKPPLRQVLLTT
jgi:hypothetical protein